jgi:tryptophan 7-halogenase
LINEKCVARNSNAFFLSGDCSMSKPYEIVIVGGGTAGWMMAAALSVKLTENVRVKLIESDDIGSVGVGEATLPQLKEFNDYIGIDEADMMSKTGATFKLGIEFVNWGFAGNSYIHPFGLFGESIGGVAFHQQWQRTAGAFNLGDYSYAVQACRANKFEFPSHDMQEVNSTYAYAYHFDAGLYAAYLRKHAEKNGVERHEGLILDVQQHPDSGEIAAVKLASGELISADFFIDCSGFRSMLLGKTLGAEFEDWSPWLPCDRAWAVPTKTAGSPVSYTRSTAKTAGWQWRIQLQHRVGNGYVYSSQFLSDEAALRELLDGVDGEPIAEPRLLKFKAGRYKKNWQKNCVAVGLASGFLEPLESTSIYLIQVATLNFLTLFPYKNNSQVLAKEFNRRMDMEYERIKNFLILHYHLNEKSGMAFWDYCRTMPIPDSLVAQIEAFQYRGYIDDYTYGLFNLPSWLAVLVGQGVRQKNVDPFAHNLPLELAHQKLKNIHDRIEQKVELMSAHEQFIQQYCPISQQ